MALLSESEKDVLIEQLQEKVEQLELIVQGYDIIFQLFQREVDNAEAIIRLYENVVSLTQGNPGALTPTVISMMQKAKIQLFSSDQ